VVERRAGRGSGRNGGERGEVSEAWWPLDGSVSEQNHLAGRVSKSNQRRTPEGKPPSDEKDVNRPSGEAGNAQNWAAVAWQGPSTTE
jgi:hypothetical protein